MEQQLALMKFTRRCVIENTIANAPMERYFNTLKNECTNLYEFTTEETLYQKVEEFAYVDYNHVRPHSYNGYRTPYEARTAA